MGLSSASLRRANRFDTRPTCVAPIECSDWMRTRTTIAPTAMPAIARPMAGCLSPLLIDLARSDVLVTRGRNRNAALAALRPGMRTLAAMATSRDIEYRADGSVMIGRLAGPAG